VTEVPSVTDLLEQVRKELYIARAIPSTGLVLRQRAVDQCVDYILSDARFNDMRVTRDNPSAITAALEKVTLDGTLAEFGV
jgi:hypothetical protein